MKIKYVLPIFLIGVLTACSTYRPEPPPPLVRIMPSAPATFEELEEEEPFFYTPPQPEPKPLPPVVKKTPISGHKPLIVIDAGHGGKDLGTHSTKAPKYQEKTLNLATAQLVRQFLHRMGYETRMTRKEDVFVSLQNRAQFANGLGSHLFVSVHYNSAPNAEAEGIEVFYYRSDSDKGRTQQSKKLAKSILNHVVQHTSAKSRGVKHGNLAVIRDTTMPAVLIEGGFLTNPEERAKLRDHEYLKKIAWGIALGIDDFLKKKVLLAAD